MIKNSTEGQDRQFIKNYDPYYYGPHQNRKIQSQTKNSEISDIRGKYWSEFIPVEHRYLSYEGDKQYRYQAAHRSRIEWVEVQHHYDYVPIYRQEPQIEYVPVEYEYKRFEYIPKKTGWVGDSVQTEKDSIKDDEHFLDYQEQEPKRLGYTGYTGGYAGGQYGGYRGFGGYGYASKPYYQSYTNRYY